MTLVRNIPGSGPAPVPVRPLVSPVIEAIVAFWTKAVEVEDIESYAEVDQIRSLWAAAEDLADDLEWMGRNYAGAWTALIPAVDASGAGDLAAVADHLDEIGPDATHALVAESWHDHTDCRSDGCEVGVVELEPAAETHARITGTLRALHERVGETLQAFEPKQKHSAELIRFLQRRMPLEQLVETVTNGVAYSAEAGIREVVLVPSALLRPWNLLFLFGDSRYIVHPISDESMEADEDTPPTWMIDLFKALGDERRLRILRHLRESEGASLGELAEYLDLAKSTTHHHVRTLRAAGLVRARMAGTEKKDEARYELREDILPDVVALVGEYLFAEPPTPSESPSPPTP